MTRDEGRDCDRNAEETNRDVQAGVAGRQVYHRVTGHVLGDQDEVKLLYSNGAT
jgi:hypothetical protein